MMGRHEPRPRRSLYLPRVKCVQSQYQKGLGHLVMGRKLIGEFQKLSLAWHRIGR